MFPIGNMIPKPDVKHFVAEIEAVEVEVEGINYAIPFVDCDHDYWCFASSTLSLRFWLTRQPRLAHINIERPLSVH